MKTGTLWLFRILSVVIAAAISYGLWSANLLPFSVFNPPTETAVAADAGGTGEADTGETAPDTAGTGDQADPAPDTESGDISKKSASAANPNTASAQDGDEDVDESDTDVESGAEKAGIDPALLKVWHSGKVPIRFRAENKEETLTIHLLNLSPEPMNLQFFLTGAEDCTAGTGGLCASLQPVSASLPGKSSTSLVLTVKGGIFYQPPADTELQLLILLENQVQTEVFPVEYKVNDLWRVAHLFSENTGNAILQLVVFLLLTVILAILLMWKVFPYFFPRAYRVLVLDMKDDDPIADLWEVFMSEFLNLQQSSSTPIQPMPLPENVELEAEIGSGDDKVKTILQLINLITPKRGYLLSMKTVASNENGKGLILNLTQNEKGQIIATQTFWAKDYGLESTPPVPGKGETENHQEEPESSTIDLDLYRKLVIPAILWTVQIYNKYFHTAKAAREAAAEDEWQSQAMAILGRSVWAMNPVRGKQLYSEALMINPKNGIALSGLGRIWLEEAQEVLEEAEDKEKAKMVEESKRRLRFGLDFLKSAQDGASKTDSVYYAAGYNGVVARLYQLSGNDHAHEENQALAVSLTSILDEAHSLLYGGKRPPKVSAKFRIYLERFIPLATIIKYSIRLVDDPLPSDVQVVQIVKEIAAELDQFTHRTQPPSVTIQDPLQCRVSLNYRVQYNYACFFSRCFTLTKDQAYADAALRYLTLALCHGGGLLKYARFDPSLMILHDGHDKDLTDRFDKITVEQPGETVPGESVKIKADRSITSIPGITPEQVESLAALKITTMDQLLLNGTDQQSRALLAQKSGIEARQLMFWMNLIDLTRVDGLSLADALMLESIGNVDTIRELALRIPENLNQTMRNLISTEKLAEWIAAAKELIPLLKY